MYQQRIERVLQHMEQAGLSQLLVSDPRSIWYLTGIEIEPYERLFAFYLAKGKKPVLFLNRLFVIPAHPFEEIWHVDVEQPIDRMAEVVDHTATLGVDKDWPARFLLPLMERCPGMPVVVGSDCVDACRACKDEAEQELMRRASKINDAVMLEVEKAIRPGMTERELSAFIGREYVKHGCGEQAFGTVVCFGANAADPHHEPDDTVLQPGQCVLVDMGCRKDHYCSDMTRTFFCGEPDEEFLKVHDLVRRANEAAEALVRPGVVMRELDAAARDLIAAEGYGPQFTHPLGHFIGQTDHEKGDVSSVSEIVAKPGMIFSIEPGVYLPGKFGVRIEDLVLVTEDGCEMLNVVDKHCHTVG